MEPKAIKVLLLEDNPDDILLLRKVLQKAKGAHFDLECVPSLQEGLEKLSEDHVDVVLLDLSLSDSKGLDTFYVMQEKAPNVPIIVLSGLDDEKLALEAVHAGAQDYLVKGRVDGQLLSRAMVYAIERTQAKVALFRAEEKYRGIFEKAVEGIFQTTPDGRYISANPALVRIYGYGSAEDLASELTDIGRMLY